MKKMNTKQDFLSATNLPEEILERLLQEGLIKPATYVNGQIFFVKHIVLGKSIQNCIEAGIPLDEIFSNIENEYLDITKFSQVPSAAPQVESTVEVPVEVPTTAKINEVNIPIADIAEDVSGQLIFEPVEEVVETTDEENILSNVEEANIQVIDFSAETEELNEVQPVEEVAETEQTVEEVVEPVAEVTETEETTQEEVESVQEEVTIRSLMALTQQELLERARVAGVTNFRRMSKSELAIVLAGTEEERQVILNSVNLRSRLLYGSQNVQGLPIDEVEVGTENGVIEATIETETEPTVEATIQTTELNAQLCTSDNVYYNAADLNSRKMSELIQIAKDIHLKYFRRMSKEELIIALSDPTRRLEMQLLSLAKYEQYK